MPVCPQCDNRVFTNKEALLQHMKSSSAWHPFCSICDRRFVSQTAYDAHMAAKHPPTYDCLTCSKSFHAPFALEDHYRGSQNHPNCVRCGRGFFDEGAREEHLLIAHPKFPCGPCGGILVYEDALEQHYSDSPNHPSCLRCGKGFKDDSAYTEHIAQIHPDLHCKSCKTSFENAEATQAHFWISPIHPKCEQCTLGFENDEAHDSHVQMVHAPTPTATATAVASTEPASAVPNTMSTAEIQMAALPEGLLKREMTPLYSTGFTPLSPKNHVHRLIVGERRVDSPDLQLHMNFASPLTDVKPLFSPTNLPRPGGKIEELWSSRENVEVPTTSRTLPQRPLPERQNSHGSPLSSHQSASPKPPLWTSSSLPQSPPRINTLAGSRSPPTASSSRTSFFGDSGGTPLTGPHPSFSPPRSSYYEPPSRPQHTTAYSGPSSFGSGTSSTFDTSRFTPRRENRHTTPTISPPRPDFQSRLYPGSVRHAARAASFSRPAPPTESALGSRNTGPPYPFGGSEYGVPLTQPRHAFMFGASNPGGGSTFGRSRGAAFASGSTTSEQVSWRELIGSRTPETRSEFGVGHTGSAGPRFLEFEEGIPTPRAEAPQSLSASSSGGPIPLESTPPSGLQAHHLPASPSLATVSSPASSALGHSPGSIQEPETRPTTASSNRTSSVHEIKYTISISSDFSTHSPDTSSPVGLVTLPAISPLISTPVDLSALDILPEAQKPLPESPPPLSPVTVVLEVVEDTKEYSPPSQLQNSFETDVEPELEPPLKSISPFSPSGSSSQSFITSPQEPSEDHEDTTNTAVSLSSPIVLHSKDNRAVGMTSPLLTPTGTPPVVETATPSNPLHCRVCLADSCDDITASMCGHIFCNRCITDAVIKTNRCPVCMTPTLLYCLFRLDLAA